MNFCKIHQQSYIDFCVYCGPPKMKEAEKNEEHGAPQSQIRRLREAK